MLESNSKLLESARFTPDGQSAVGLDPVMLLALWCQHLVNKQRSTKQIVNEQTSSETVSPCSSRSSSPLNSNTSPTSSSPPSSGDSVVLGISPPSKNFLYDNTTVEPPYVFPHDAYIAAGMGKPAYPINPALLEEIDQIVSSLRKQSRLASVHAGISMTSQTKSTNGKTWRDLISEKDAVSDYGPPQGNLEARKRMARALSRWYFGEKHDISHSLSPDDILFTVGEVAGLHDIFTVLNRDIPGGRIVTPFPFYSLYQGAHKQNNLHPIYITEETDYKLTARCLEKSLHEAEKLIGIDKRPISAFLFCDPNNPFGTIVDNDEWVKIASILRKYPNVPIILDECYTTMRLDGGRCASLLTLAPDLRERLVILRSATKALSAAGERMAVVIIPNKKMRTKIVAENVAINGHAPTLLQAPFAAALEQYDEIEHKSSNNYYQRGVEIVANRLRDMGAALPGNYQPTGAFYVMADLHELIGSHLPSETKQVLGEPIVPTDKIQSDIGIVYSLLFKDKVMVAAGSFFGLPATAGYVRITASRGCAELNELMNRIEHRLRSVRLEKINELLLKIRTNLNFLATQDSIDSALYEGLNCRLVKFEKTDIQSPRTNQLSTKDMKQIIIDLKSLAAEVRDAMPKGKRAKDKAASIIYSFYRGNKTRKDFKAIKAEITARYLSYVAERYKALPTIQAAMFKLRSYEWVQMSDCKKLQEDTIKTIAKDKITSPRHPIHFMK